MKQNILLVILASFGYLNTIRGYKNYGVEEMYYWKDVYYENLPYEDDTLIGKYPYHIPANNDVVGIGYHAKSGIMLATVGRIRAGVPSTLNAFCVADYDKESSPKLWGFPSYRRNTLKSYFYEGFDKYSRQLNSDYTTYSAGYYTHFFESELSNPITEYSIISVYHPNIDDQCNRLYVVDTGVLSYGVSEVYNVQNPAIIVFDLPSNACQRRQFPVIRRIDIPNNFWKNPIGFVYIAIDHQARKSCDDVFLYITNTMDSSLTVYDYKRGSFWAFSDPSMGPIITESQMVFNNYFNYDFRLGIMNVALGWTDNTGSRNAYFAPGSSTSEYIVSTKLLKTPQRTPLKYNPLEFFLIGHRGCHSQAFKQVFDSATGIMFFAELQSKKIRCWNTQLPLNTDTIATVFESEALQFVSEINVDTDGYLWFHSCHLPLAYLSDIPLNTTDFKPTTFRIRIFEATRGTVCEYP
ncbi:L-dopachrome tautomerase yellow-f2-like [Phlebotomus papatasi]|uniref:L-dopachrome tautomerase yellow-f2-like n=1 Tax=Phlebotomus papatasi TaxID=29031 RepID=UPI002483C2C6|nr:L-dopachrome tautomerase yellow-f2-like [Phlebotomus papatasi]